MKNDQIGATRRINGYLIKLAVRRYQLTLLSCTAAISCRTDVIHDEHVVNTPFDGVDVDARYKHTPVNNGTSAACHGLSCR